MKIFYETDEQNRIIPICDWDESIIPNDSWQIGDITGNAYNEYAIPLWKSVNGHCVKRTENEIQNDINNLIKTEPTTYEIFRADIDYILMLLGE